MEKYIDLHVHTKASDGSMTPSQVARYAAKDHLAAIAITDHDTIDGVKEAVAEGERYDVEVVPGIEIGVEFEVELHILGYYIDIKSKKLNDTLNQLQCFRQERNPQIVKKLNALGFAMNMADVSAKAEGSVVGRPHIAAVMLEKGYINNIDEAFEKYLGKGKCAYVDKKKLTPAEGIRLIEEAGGLAVLAHPVYLEQHKIDLEALVKQLMRYGLSGIEGYYPDHSKETHEKYLALARKHHLLVTGGSDFHGSHKPHIKLGKGYGDLKVPYDLLTALKQASKDNRLQPKKNGSHF